MPLAVVAAAASDRPPMPTTLPNPVIPKPPLDYTEADLERMKLEAMNAETRLIVRGVELTVPDDAVVDGPQVHAGIPNQQVADLRTRISAERAGQTPAPGETPTVYASGSLDTPIYSIVVDNEIASVSGSTGEWQVGEGHEDTFQFLADQLGADKMQIVYSEVYELRWGPWRADQVEE